MNGTLTDLHKKSLIHGNVCTAAFLETLDRHPGELSEGKLTNINEESGCDEKDKHVPEEVVVKKKFTLEDI